MSKTPYFTLVALLIPLIVFAENAGPAWRAPTSDELGQDSAWRNEHPNRYLLIRADFDGDGKEDAARLLVNDEDDKIGLFVTMAFQKKTVPLLVETIKDKSLIEVFGIEVAKPGMYKTACGKGYWECKGNEPKELRLKNPGIDFFKYQSASSYFIWNSGEKRFDRIWMSD